MKILQLKLLAFGPFTDVFADFSRGEQGLHIVYGPNEAGKSSALRALRQLLYGIPGRSQDDFIHPYAKMRIGGVLRHSNGAVIEVVRRKGRLNTLRGGDDDKPVDEALFQKYLGNIETEVFATMFGIGHADLVKGGEEIIKGGGDVGQALFAAGAGISDLRKVQMELQAEAEALFTPSASKRPINEAISNFRNNQKSLKEAQLPGHEWEKHDTALRTAIKRRNDIDLELQEKKTEKHRLERISEALPLISRRKELLKDLGSYSNAVLLPDDFGQRRTELLENLRIEENNKDQSQENIKDASKSMERLEIDYAVLDNTDLIEEHYKELGGYQKAAKDRIKLQTRRDVLWSEAREILAGLRDDFNLEEAEKLRLKKTEIVRIQELGAQYERLMAKLENVKEGISKCTHQIKGLEDQLKEFETAVNVDDLKEALPRAAKYSALEDHYHSECKEIDNVLSSLEIELRKQTLWPGNLDELNTLAKPSIETIDTFDNQFDEAQRHVAQLHPELRDVENTIVDIDGQLRELELEREVPTEEDLKIARENRDKGWRFVRDIIEKDKEPGDGIQAFIDAVKPANTLIEAYEMSVYRVDEVADRLRFEADRVARKAKLISDKETQGIRHERLKAEAVEARGELDEIKKSWSRVWEPIGISPQTPREMRTWVQNQEGIIKQHHEVQERRRKAEDLKFGIDGCCSDLYKCLRSISEHPAESREALTDLMVRSQRVIERQENIRNRKENLLANKRQRIEEMGEAKSKLRKIEEDLSKWQRQWETAIQPLGLEADAIPAQANVVIEEIKTLFDKLKEAENVNKRIRGIDNDAETFINKVSDLVEQVARDMKEIKNVEQDVSELNIRLNRSRAAKSQLDSLKKQRNKENKRVRDADQRMIKIKSKLDAMCEEAACSKYVDLSEAEIRSTKRRQHETEVRDVEERLHRLSAGATVDDFVKEAEEVDPDGINGWILRLNESIDALNEEKSELDQTIGEKRNELKKMDGSAQAADLAEANQGILARLENDVEQFARLRLASTVLAQAIEKYRQKHQDPILKRTNEVFARLTLGFFEGIRAEFDDNGDLVLMGVRSGGKELVGVQGMSDGTTDQLYLSLRLSSLESYLENNEPMPFIVDDILIKFDNERAMVTLQALADLSMKTQVIFFTHHRHLVELAEANIDSNILFKHTLAASKVVS